MLHIIHYGLGRELVIRLHNGISVVPLVWMSISKSYMCRIEFEVVCSPVYSWELLLSKPTPESTDYW
ncbi:hypothetical protein KC19_4G022300 [Ceratodon purpureus]|nr:hypothetical protein KC19_4G022300 [Ceratodon purpureus]